MKRVYKFILESRELLFWGTIKGLVSEREKLRNLFTEFKPEVMFLGISPEEMKGLERYLKEPFDIEPEDYEVIYGLKLERYGEVGLPVPTYLEAFALSRKDGVDMIPIDMPDEEFSDLYVNTIDIFHLMHFNFRKRKIWRKKFEAETPEEFVLMWDKEVNKIPQYRKIENEREKYMSRRIKELLKERCEKKIMIIIELERLHGVLDNLNLLHTT
ncbi:hypothetical protein AciM339_1283 [Aciduliprofundum sp. MAR08-339]|uniref:hypothetical protein n=1 Tax=Aciduliprofundum sp. (strain MAR08-339) TaxID=673860 RepID=UPI0002A4C573|nr:hypothetical protein AciM339_1283 [Aciduliprofundum sp. MAR08-339]